MFSAPTTVWTNTSRRKRKLSFFFSFTSLWSSVCLFLKAPTVSWYFFKCTLAAFWRYCLTHGFLTQFWIEAARLRSLQLSVLVFRAF